MTIITVKLGKYHDLVCHGEYPILPTETDIFNLEDYPEGDSHNVNDYATEVCEPINKSNSEIAIVYIYLDRITTGGDIKFTWYKKKLLTDEKIFEYTSTFDDPHLHGYEAWLNCWSVSWIGRFDHEIKEAGDYYCKIKTTWGDKKKEFEVTNPKEEFDSWLEEKFTKWWNEFIKPIKDTTDELKTIMRGFVLSWETVNKTIKSLCSNIYGFKNIFERLNKDLNIFILFFKEIISFGKAVSTSLIDLKKRFDELNEAIIKIITITIPNFKKEFDDLLKGFTKIITITIPNFKNEFDDFLNKFDNKVELYIVSNIEILLDKVFKED